MSARTPRRVRARRRGPRAVHVTLSGMPRPPTKGARHASGGLRRDIRETAAPSDDADAGVPGDLQIHAPVEGAPTSSARISATVEENSKVVDLLARRATPIRATRLSKLPVAKNKWTRNARPLAHARLTRRSWHACHLRGLTGMAYPWSIWTVSMLGSRRQSALGSPRNERNHATCRAGCAPMSAGCRSAQNRSERAFEKPKA